MSNAPNARDPHVWITVVDPQEPDATRALADWSIGTASEWVVPAAAHANDLVLAWLAGGTGFRFVLSVMGAPRVVDTDETAPQRAMLAVVERIHPAVSMSRLKNEPSLRSWWVVRYNMQGVVRAQQHDLRDEPEWPAFLRLLASGTPKAAQKLRGRSHIDSAAASRSEPVPVVFSDDGSTSSQSAVVTPRLADVLAAAASINAKRDSFDLSFSSLLTAFLCTDTWLTDYFAAQQINVGHILRKLGKDLASARAAVSKGIAERAAILQSPLRRSISARQAIEEATRISHAQGAPHPDAPHLLAAFITLTEYHEEDFGALTLDRDKWGAAFAQRMVRDATDAGDVAFWRRLYSRRFNRELPQADTAPSGGHRPDYDPDAYTSKDLLSIEDEVDALAYVIAARQTRPPLAIGLFGEWGSGKTFFMKHLQRRIERLCHGARGQQPGQRDCYGHIAQIEFNAWHYQEGDLWASLVDHILRNLRFGEDEDEAKLAERRDQIVNELDVTEQRRTDAAARVADADQRVTDAQTHLDQLKETERTRRQELAEQLTSREMLVAARTSVIADSKLKEDAVELGAQLHLPIVLDNAADLQKALSGLRAELSGVWAFLVPMMHSRDRGTRAILLAVSLAAPVALGLLISAVLADRHLVGNLAGLAGGVVAFMGTATKWLQAQQQRVAALRNAVEPVARDVDAAIDREIESAVNRDKAAVAEKLAELEALHQQQAEARKERDDAASQAATLKTRIATLADDGLMRAFLDDRIGGGLYQQKLGTAALVRRDFERLSRKIEQVTKREAEGALKGNELIINRIVLYIDDLDRCEMEKVVPVLRAVHLLLAFPAFVVVVGVDSRWVARCLERHHPDIFAAAVQDTTDAPVTPLDYLEKIFQIPIWLEPVPTDRRVVMVRELLRNPALSRVAVRGAATGPSEVTIDAPPNQQTLARVGDDTVPSGHEAPGAEQVHVDNSQAISAVDEDSSDLDLNPKGLEVTDGEHEFLGRLGQLLSSSPRTIKRFVNTYRLINVALEQAGYRDPQLSPQNFEVRMLLLAVLVGMPELSRWLQEALRRADDTNQALAPLVGLMTSADAVIALDALPERWRGRAQMQWGVVRTWLDQSEDEWSALPAARLMEWLEPVGRYTFNLTRAPLTPSPTRSSALPHASPFV